MSPRFYSWHESEFVSSYERLKHEEHREMWTKQLPIQMQKYAPRDKGITLPKHITKSQVYASVIRSIQKMSLRTVCIFTYNLCYHKLNNDSMYHLAI